MKLAISNYEMGSKDGGVEHQPLLGTESSEHRRKIRLETSPVFPMPTATPTSSSLPAPDTPPSPPPAPSSPLAGVFPAESLPVFLALRSLWKVFSVLLSALTFHPHSKMEPKKVRNNGEFLSRFRLAWGADRHGVQLITSSEPPFFHCESEKVEKRKSQDYMRL